MKQTNNAIKFLMAQYRAIFKNAYFKGLTTAAVVTMAMAAGQAQAAKANAAFTGAEILPGTTVTITGDSATDSEVTKDKYTKIEISASNAKNKDIDIVIKSGATTANKIQGAAAINFTANSITIDTTNAAHGLAVTGQDQSKSVTLKLNDLNVKAGSLDLVGHANGPVDVQTKTITLNGAKAADAKITLATKATLGSAAVSDSLPATQINLAKDGTIVLSGATAATDAVLNGQFVGKGKVTIDFQKSGTVAAFGEIQDATLTIGDGATGNITLVDVAKTAAKEDTLKINSGSITFAKAASALTVDKGTLELGDVTFTQSEASTAANLVVGGGKAGENGTLKLKKETFDSLLAASSLKIDKSGSVVFLDNSVELGGLEILASASGPSQIAVVAGAVIGAENVIVNSAFTGAKSGDVTIKASNMLTLGDGISASAKYGPKLEAKNLTLVKGPAEDNFSVKDTITLSSTLDDGIDTTTKNPKIKAGQGTITGDALNLNLANNTDAFTIAAGNYQTAGQDVVLTKGILTVSSAVPTFETSTDKVESSLVINGGKLTIAAADGLIKVDGTNASLDLTNTTIVQSGERAADTAHVTVSEGTLLLKGAQVADLVKEMPSGSGVKATSIDLTKNGVLKIVDDLTISGSMLSGSDISTTKPTKPVINFDAKSGQSGGVLEVAKTLTIEGADTAVNIGKDGHIKATDLILKPATAGAEAKLGSGNYHVLNTLDSDKSIKAEANAVINLGRLDFVNGKDATDGHIAVHGADTTINPNLNLSVASTSALNVLAGNWIAEGDIEATGILTVGSTTKPLDANDKVITTSLTTNKKLTAKAGGVVVNGNGSLTINELAASGAAAITNSGIVVINGKAGEDASGNTTYGVTFEAGSFALKDGGTLTFAGAAMDGFKFSGDSLLNSGYVAGSVTTELGSEVNLNYTANDPALSKTQLDVLTSVFGKDGKINGIVNLGAGTIENLAASGGTISWNDAKEYVNYLPGITTDNLKEAQLTDVKSTITDLTGHFGSVKTDKSFASGDLVTFNKKGGLYNAKAVTESGDKYFIVNEKGQSLGLAVAEKGHFTLGGEGIVDSVKLNAKSTLVINKGFNDVVGNVTVSKDIAGDKTAALEIKSGNLTVVGDKKKGVSVGKLTTAAGTSLTTNNLALTGEGGAYSEIKGDVTVKADPNNKVVASTSIGKGGAEFGGKNNLFTGTFVSEGYLGFSNGGSTVIDLKEGAVATVKDDLDIWGDAKVEVKGVLSISRPTNPTDTQNGIYIGEYSPNNANIANSSGFLKTNYLHLNGNYLVIDPQYGKNTSVVEVGSFAQYADKLDARKSVIDGDIYVLQNSALLVGMNELGEYNLDSAHAFLANAQENGSLLDPTKKGNDGKIGSLLYLNSQQTIAKKGDLIVVDGVANMDNFTDAQGMLNVKYTDPKDYGAQIAADSADIYLGKGSVIALGEGAHKADGSIVFNFTDASVYSEGGRIILDSDSYLKGDRFITIFQDQDVENKGVKILGEAGVNDIRVETINGLMYFTLQAGTEVTGNVLRLDTTKVDTAFNQASTPMKDFLVGYTAMTQNWKEFFADTPVVEGAKATLVERVELLGNEGPAADSFVIEGGKIKGFKNAADFDVTDKPSNYIAVKTGENADQTPSYTVYHKASNAFLENIVRNTQGAAADQAARMGAFGGAAQSALLANSANAESVAGRFGMGHQTGTMTIANNGQGSSMWVTPLYKSQESSGFAAEGLNYGADISLYGLALGGDVTLASNIRVGGMFNVGSGDADGQGAASVVSNDFDYFGGAIYAGYTLDNISLVADISYSQVDSDVESNTQVGKTKTSFDTTALSAGVTGQYSLKLAQMDVTPHAGLRFTRIDMDDYSIGSEEYGEVGKFKSSSTNIFSIPVGVTISKEYVGDTWTVKPSFDLTLTGNFGDDTLDGNVSWNGVSNYDVTTKTEFIDSFTYGASVGMSAKSGNFGLGFGLNYTGSSNVDEFGVNANARYMF